MQQEKKQCQCPVCSSKHTHTIIIIQTIIIIVLACFIVVGMSGGRNGAMMQRRSRDGFGDYQQRGLRGDIQNQDVTVPVVSSSPSTVITPTGSSTPKVNQ